MKEVVQMAEMQSIASTSFVDYVRQEVEVVDSKTTNEYALKSFLSYMQTSELQDVSIEALICWVVSLFLNGKTANTVKRYLCRLHVAYIDWITSTNTPIKSDSFNGLLALAVQENEVKSSEALSNLNLIKKLVTDDTYSGDSGKWKAVFCYMLYNPDASAEDVVNLQFDKTPKYCSQTVEIVESRDKSNGRKYVFALDQANKRTPQIVREILDNTSCLLKAIGMKFKDGFTRESITAMWICSALKAGVRVDEIRAIVPAIPKEYSIISHVKPAQLSDRDRQNIICRVANRINDITTRWYVVNMRSNFTVDAVKDSVKKSFPTSFRQMYFFYPTRQVYRESRRKKKVKMEVPFIPGLLFIKMRSDIVGKVMNEILDVAWGYKCQNTPDSPYSVISQRAMTDFQRHIGEFTDDIRMEIFTEKKPLAVNDTVTVYGDLIDGSVGEITEIKEKDGKKTYSIRLTQDKTFHWTVTIDDELRLEPFSEESAQKV